MATPNFDALVAKVRNWANRDSSILTDALITDFLDYSADTCYRKLRIPPLEYTYLYPTITSASTGETSLQLPPDLTEIISMRRTNSAGTSSTFMKNLGLRSFEDNNTSKPQNSFSYKGGNIIFHPAAEEGEVFEIHYYRRLFDLNATYVVNQANINAGNTTTASSGDEGAVEFPASSGNYYTGNEVYNWLRDDNERALLFGALAHAMDYLGDNEASMKYFQKQEMAIQELNNEETYRKVRGSSNQITYEVSELM
jgi:hypothetical protein|tara:strand:- start:782 stop:1543 length:762 start_codon:yes stop_codon:yes gene_type:complete